MKAFIFFLALTLSFCLGITNSPVDLDDQSPNGKWLTIQGAPAGAGLGRAVRNIGDFNGDGIDDMVVSASNTMNPDTLYVIYGQKVEFSTDSINVNSTYAEGFLIKGPLVGSNFGYSVSKPIDLNGDGLSDIVIGTFSKNIVYVIYGKKGHNGDIIIKPDFTFSSQGFAVFGFEFSSFGYSISSAGDFNDDGLDDLLIGAPSSQTGSGATYVLYGRKEVFSNLYLNESLSSNQWLTITNLAYPGRMSSSLDGVGDINGDGIDDIMLGAPDTFSGQGIVYVLYGNKNFNGNMITINPSMGTEGFMIYGTQLNPMRFGNMVSSAGDINGDGVGDIIIGGLLPTGGGLLSASRVYVFYGKTENWPSMIQVDGGLLQGFLIVDGRSAIAALGITVSGGGDINGDGIDDILVRARNTTGGGYVAVIYGRPLMLNGYLDIYTDLTIDKGFVIAGSVLFQGAIFNSVSSGDLNNDHIDDIIIGAPQASMGVGKAYVVFGSNGCPRNCSACESSKCLACFKGYGYGLYKSACGDCPVGTYLSKEGRCEECLDDCIKCKSSSKCQVCAEGYTMSDSQTCISEGKETQAAISTGLFDGASSISNTLAIGSSVPTSFGLVAKILRNTKYLNISVSKDLQATFNSWKISSGIFPAPDSDSQGLLPLMFERYGMEKAFLINYWKSFTMILLGLGIFIICKGAEIIFSKNSSMSKITRSVNVAASNFVLTQFYGSIDDILFYFVLDIRSSEKTSSGFRTFGFILGLVFLVVGLIVTGLHGMILWRYQQIKKKQGSENKQTDFLMQFLKKYENMKLFYQDFKDVDVFQQAFLLINITRSLLSSFIFTMLFHYPMLQILLLIALNVMILVYLFMKRPFKDKANAYAQYYCEGILSFAYLSILILAFKDEAESEASGGLKGLSTIVIVCNMMLLIGSAVFMFVNIGGILYKTYQERKSAVAKKKGSVAIRSRLEYSNKADFSKGDITVENSLNHNERSQVINESHLSHSGLVVLSDSKVENLVHSSLAPSDHFQTMDVSPASFMKRRTLKVKNQRNGQSSVVKPSLTENQAEAFIQQSPDVSPFMNSQQESSLLWLNSQSNFLLNPVEIKEEAVMEMRTGQNNDIVLETFQDEAKIDSGIKEIPLEYSNEEDIQDINASNVVEKKAGNINRRKIKKNKKINSDS